MTQKEKLIEKFLKNPENLNFPKIEKILIDLNFEKINAKGSHVKFKHHKLNRDIVIPVHNNECKNFYKKELSKHINKIKL